MASEGELVEVGGDAGDEPEDTDDEEDDADQAGDRLMPTGPAWATCAVC
jgi:hypothetical protein